MEELVEVYVMMKDRAAAIVRYRDKDGMLQASIIPSDKVADVNIGQVAHIPVGVIENSGTEYGFDWAVALDEVVLTPDDFTQVLRDHGIWTIEDLLAKPNEGVAAFMSLAKSLYVDLVKRARECIVG